MLHATWLAAVRFRLIRIPTWSGPKRDWPIWGRAHMASSPYGSGPHRSWPICALAHVGQPMCVLAQKSPDPYVPWPTGTLAPMCLIHMDWAHLGPEPYVSRLYVRHRWVRSICSHAHVRSDQYGPGLYKPCPVEHCSL